MRRRAGAGRSWVLVAGLALGCASEEPELAAETEAQGPAALQLALGGRGDGEVEPCG